MSAARDSLFPFADQMREFASNLTPDLGPMFGRDVVRLLDLADAQARVIACYEAIKYKRPVRDFDEALSALAHAKAALGG